MCLFYIAIQRSAPFVRRIADTSLSLSFLFSILHFVPFALLLLLRRDFIGLFQLFGTYFIFMQIFYSVLYRIDFDRFVYVFFMCQPYSLFISFLFSSPLSQSLSSSLSPSILNSYVRILFFVFALFRFSGTLVCRVSSPLCKFLYWSAASSRLVFRLRQASTNGKERVQRERMRGTPLHVNSSIREWRK